MLVCPYEGCGADELLDSKGRLRYPRTCREGHKWWEAHAGPQELFVHSNAQEVLYGGAAGGGKSSSLVVAPLQWHHDPEFRAILFRREAKQLRDLKAEARVWYKLADPGAREVQDGDGCVWKFSSGAEFQFAHCALEKDAENYQGRQFQYEGFDELTHFLRSQYLFIKGRVRSPKSSLPRFVRATSNPGGDGHEWVFDRWGPWLNPECNWPGLKPRFDGQRVPPVPPNAIIWVLRVGEQDVVVSAAEAAQRDAYADEDPDDVERQEVRARSRQFIPALLKDNPALLRGDPGYVSNLLELDVVRREQQLKGNWLIRVAAGLLFKREWFRWISRDALPRRVLWIRYWDRAAAVPKSKGGKSQDPDWTVGLKVGKFLLASGEAVYVIADMVRFRGAPPEVQRRIRATAEADGKGVHIVFEQDPAAAGEAEAYQLAELVDGWPVHFLKPTGDKITRASAASPQVEKGRWYIVRDPSWDISAFFHELEAFPDGDHDDCVDTLSGAHAHLAPLEVETDEGDDFDDWLPKGRG